MRAENLLSLTKGDDPFRIESKIWAFTSILLLHLAFRDFFEFLDTADAYHFYLFAILLCCFLGSLTKKLQKPALYIALLLAAYKFALIPVLSPNHFFLEFLCLVFTALALQTPSFDGSNFLRASEALKWIPVLVLILSAIQKMSYGTYFDGSFFALKVGTGFKFDHAFQWMLTAEEFARLKNTQFPGPYYFSSILPIAVSNAVYVTEILAGVLLLKQRYRMAGFWSAIVIVIAIEAVAFELMFGLLMLNLLLLYIPKDINRRMIPFFLISYLVLVLARFGFLPFQFN